MKFLLLFVGFSFFIGTFSKAQTGTETKTWIASKLYFIPDNPLIAFNPHGGEGIRTPIVSGDTTTITVATSVDENGIVLKDKVVGYQLKLGNFKYLKSIKIWKLDGSSGMTVVRRNAYGITFEVDKDRLSLRETDKCPIIVMPLDRNSWQCLGSFSLFMPLDEDENMPARLQKAFNHLLELVRPHAQEPF